MKIWAVQCQDFLCGETKSTEHDHKFISEALYVCIDLDSWGEKAGD